ncbi:MAG: hypothetical protein ABSA97_14775 [Verrucomicrobiia bacterium]|jgi:hypothetical protein
MSCKQRELFIQFNQVSDALVIAAVFWLSHAFREELAFRHPPHFSLIAPFRYYKWLYLVVLPLFPFLLAPNGFYMRPLHYRRRLTLWILVKSVSVCALIVIAATYFLGLAAASKNDSVGTGSGRLPASQRDKSNKEKNASAESSRPRDMAANASAHKRGLTSQQANPILSAFLSFELNQDSLMRSCINELSGSSEVSS